MPLDDFDLSYLIDIYQCASDFVEFTSNIQFHEFENDKIRKLATERQLEVLGQAANKIKKETQNLFPNIPWAQVIGLRNKLAHDYGEILAKRIWDISRNSIPALVKDLEEIAELRQYIRR